MNKLSFRIRKRYFDAIVSGEKTVEYRRDIHFWRVRIGNIFGDPELLEMLDQNLFFRRVTPEPVIGVFICGKEIHRRYVNIIARQNTPENFSAQGKKDVNTETCFAFYLGRELS